MGNAADIIASIITTSIEEGIYPGAVVLAAHHGDIIYKGVFGSQSLLPTLSKMQFNTIFDVASLTKVVVTAPAIMQLIEQGKLDLNAPVAHYWESFGQNSKSLITIRQLLTHTSGLPATIPSRELNQLLPLENRVPDVLPWRGKEHALRQVTLTKPLSPPDTSFIYSDINFIALGYLVELITHMPLDQYAKEYIFKPAEMHDSYFMPPHELQSRIAPTELLEGQLRWGEPHDPTVHLMGGVGGMAGLFTTAEDLAKFAQIILNKGKTTQGFLLKPETVKLMTTSHTPPNLEVLRGLGWDIKSPYSCGGDLSSTSSFGHTGWTGTSIWIDPIKETWLIILTNRTHPKASHISRIKPNRLAIANAIAKLLVIHAV